MDNYSNAAAVGDPAERARVDLAQEFGEHEAGVLVPVGAE